MTFPKFATVAGCLLGAVGVALLAIGSHLAGGLATTAGQQLLFHAAAAVALAGAIESGRIAPGLGRIGLALVLAGVVVFSADLTLRAFGWSRLFPMAAPAGGSATILGWVVLAVAAMTAAGRAR